ncbi:carbon-phosphorus lyase subunit PhnH [Camelimonas fluminis]|uniref:Phosphonate C-P lyase system protein PhnH n=1 Tax=Camelimonas fluminis TaxID=1576911 RepID=A0ABV7ULY5_9HYPH|nr:phosphonate C-P lyase system protein PhnH [Camelimonas fluminis]GHE60801.1 carbon-phosphorus lyase subunit PhnH [Camelimonas fluminis]
MTGFADPALESQQAFRAIMEAMARPTSVQPLPTGVQPPAPLSPELAAVILTLADNDVALWLDAPLRAAPEVARYLRFHTSAALVDNPADADFALIAAPEACPPLAAFRQGEPQFPERAATLVLQADRFDAPDSRRFSGPGLAPDARALSGDVDAASPEGIPPGQSDSEKTRISANESGVLAVAPLPAGFDRQITLNRAQFPLGVDLIFVAPGAVSALPRSAILEG